MNGQEPIVDSPAWVKARKNRRRLALMRVSSKRTPSLVWSNSIHWPNGPLNKSGTTSTSSRCPITVCMIKDIRASAAFIALVTFNRGKICELDDGRILTKPSAVCTNSRARIEPARQQFAEGGFFMHTNELKPFHLEKEYPACWR